MEMNKNQEERFLSRIHNFLTDETEAIEAVQEISDEGITDNIEETLKDKGFPSDIDIEDVDYTLRLSQTAALEDWIDLYNNSFSDYYETSEEIESMIHSDSDILDILLVGFSKHYFHIHIQINETAARFANEHPNLDWERTIESLESRISDGFLNELVADGIIESEDDNFVDKVNELIKSEGESGTFDDFKDEIVIVNPRFPLSPTDIAYRLESEIESSANWRAFLGSNRFKSALIRINAIDYDVEFYDEDVASERTERYLEESYTTFGDYIDASDIATFLEDEYRDEIMDMEKEALMERASYLEDDEFNDILENDADDFIHEMFEPSDFEMIDDYIKDIIREHDVKNEEEFQNIIESNWLLTDLHDMDYVRVGREQESTDYVLVVDYEPRD